MCGCVACARNASQAALLLHNVAMFAVELIDHLLVGITTARLSIAGLALLSPAQPHTRHM